MPKEVVLDFSKPAKRKAKNANAWVPTRYRYWHDRRGLPPELADWLSKEHFPIYPKTSEELRDREQIEIAIRRYFDVIEIFKRRIRTVRHRDGTTTQRPWTQKEAEKAALQLIIEKSKLYNRDKYTIFTIGSP